MVVGERAESKGRFERIKGELLASPMYLCPERALLVTEYFKKFDNPSEPMVVRKARAFKHLLSRKSVQIFPDELIVGNVGSRRKSAIMQPELSGVFVSQELLWIDRRKTTPFQISWADRFRIAVKVLPYWLPRSLLVRSFWPRWKHLAKYTREQLQACYYLVNEVAGIGHFLPGYEKVLRLGLTGIIEGLAGRRDDQARAVVLACEGLMDFAERLSTEARRQAEVQSDPNRRFELEELARILQKAPREPATTFHEALQSLWLTHLGVCLESINSAVSFGRVDQFLYPYYHRDLEAGRITPERARELLLCFSAKTTEHVFMMSEQSSQYHGGYLVVQAAVVGGQDSAGHDSVNELTYLFLDVMERSGLRDPNYQVRLHPGSPREFIRRAADVARQGNGVPALFNDEAAIEALTSHGYTVEEARDYGVVGCVELALPGRSFLSTDAALFNLPVCLELALNQGRRLGKSRRVGAATPPLERLRSMADIRQAYEKQVDFMVGRLIADIQVIEKGNRDFHPTPFSSMLVEGCLESGRDLTAGGAKYNSSGIQGVGVADTADSLAALDEVVFTRKRYTLAQVVAGMKDNFRGDPRLKAELIKAPKFGNNLAAPDDCAAWVVRVFHQALSRHHNTRGGPYVPGFYSSTCHVGFGRVVGALPSGREAGQPFAASLGSANGRDRLGPTALLNSVARVDSRLAPNGYALNLQFDPRTLGGDKGVEIVSGLVEGFFASGGLELQLNVVATEVLQDARANPGKYPGLVVRVAGYCAYFDDLPDTVKGEIIGRNPQAI